MIPLEFPYDLGSALHLIGRYWLFLNFHFWASLLLQAILSGSAQKPFLATETSAHIPLDCAAFNLTRKCPAYFPTSISENPGGPSVSACPEYFRWIHEDLRPWAGTGITREMVERAKTTANFRLVIVNGKVYLEKYRRAFQTRDVFTLWGILQLLQRYPGKVPDLELMLDCFDWPVVKLSEYSGERPNSTAPPPLFGYCGDDDTLDIVFPDWSFWGW